MSILMNRALLPKAWDTARLTRVLAGKVAPARPPGPEEIALNTFHNQVAEQVSAMLRGNGCAVQPEITFVSVPPRFTYRADLVALAPESRGGGPPSVIEIKTSLTNETPEEFADEFRRDQFAMLVLIQLGFHVATPTLRAILVGLPVNTPLPPLPIDIVYVIPGLPFSFKHIRPGEMRLDEGRPH